MLTFGLLRWPDRDPDRQRIGLDPRRARSRSPGLSVTTTSTSSQVSVTGNSIALSFLGQTLTGSFSFQETTMGASTVVEVTVTSATIPLGGFGNVSISNGSLLLANGGVAGALR